MKPVFALTIFVLAAAMCRAYEPLNLPRNTKPSTASPAQLFVRLLSSREWSLFWARCFSGHQATRSGTSGNSLVSGQMESQDYISLKLSRGATRQRS